MGESFENMATNFRDDLFRLEEKARAFSDVIKKSENIKGDKGEVIAQSIIAMRHIEDARMRYGKVIQYLGDGVSKFDK